MSWGRADDGRHQRRRRSRDAASYAAAGPRRELHRLALHQQPGRPLDRAELQVRQRSGSGARSRSRRTTSPTPATGGSSRTSASTRPTSRWLWPEFANNDRLHLTLTVGGFTNRYGAAGRYDGGKYETYLFGRTHVAGFTTNLTYDASEDWSFQVEGGFGADLEPIPFYGPPQGAMAATPLQQLAAWEPYPGPVPQESTFVAHGHLGAVFKKQLHPGRALHLRVRERQRTLDGLHRVDVQHGRTTAASPARRARAS